MANVQAPQTAGDFAAFAQLRAQAGANAPAAAKEAARQFEALFVQQMLKSMRAAGDVMGDNSEKSYRDMFDQQIAMEISKGKGIGLASMLNRQLGGQSGPQGTTSAGGVLNTQTSNIGAVIPAPVNRPPSVESGIPVQLMASTLPEPAAPSLDSSIEESPTQPAREDWRPSGPLEFLKDLAPYAEKAAKQLGVSARAILAQAALETGWGQNVVRDSQGMSSNNLFNIKAGAQWMGEQVHAKTLEFANGITEQKNATFRSYPNLAAAFDDYVKVLGNNPRYSGVLHSGSDPSQFAASLQKAGYATDPSYADKLRSVMSSPRFESLVGQLKKFGHMPTSF